MTIKQLDELHYWETIDDLILLLEQYGPRRVAEDLNYKEPALFEDFTRSINQVTNNRKIPALLQARYVK